MAFLSKLSRIFPRIFRRRSKLPVASDLAELEKLIGHRFKEPSLLQIALTHPSHTASRSSLPPAARVTAKGAKAHKAGGKAGGGAAAKSAHIESYNNQRLEFLGDAVLNLVLAETLYIETDAAEGLLTDARSRVSCGEHLARVGRELGLGALLRVARNGDTARIRESDSANEDALEALFGAVFLDGGLNSARKLARRLFSDDLQFNASDVSQGRSAKSRLQELVQDDGRPNDGKRIEYRAVASGPSHARRFQVEVFVDGILQGCGEGRTKRAASELAASATLALLGR